MYTDKWPEGEYAKKFSTPEFSEIVAVIVEVKVKEVDTKETLLRKIGPSNQNGNEA